MKRLLIISILALLGMTQLAAQEHEYLPFVREGVKWVYSYTNEETFEGDPFKPNLPLGTVYLTLELKGDTVINGKTYKAMHKYYGDSINTVNDTIPVYLREENKVVYGIVPGGRQYDDCPVGNSFDYKIEYKIRDGEEFVLYDFQDPQAYWGQRLPNDPTLPPMMHISDLRYTYYTKVGTHWTKNYVFRIWTMTEGIGLEMVSTPSLGYVLHPVKDRFVGPDCIFKSSHVIENGDTIFKSINYEEPQSAYNEDDVIPYLTPGVKFVNEKVIVNHGDTTSQYYTYEMTPSEQNNVYRCHYIVEDIDSIISGIRSSDPTTYRYYPGNFSTFSNRALAKMRAEGRAPSVYNEGGNDYLYGYYNFVRSIVCSYIQSPREEESFLNNDNFAIIDPIVVEGQQMRRFAYLGEQGDTLAYVVQGIGFDSRDMGDLLTPFTRRPDPDADYQEWCGLSHVIKDGKIIYKGMRYREGAFDGISEVVADRTRRPADPHYYNLMGQPVGTTVPSTPGIYIHQGKKVVVR